MSFSVLLDNVRSAYNVGSVFRTCDSAGVETLYLTGISAFPPHSKLDKTALGSLNSVNWVHHCQPEQAVAYLSSKNIPIICFESTDTALPLFDTKLPKESCLVFGSETNGISQAVLDQADLIVKIPQYGLKESLNIASAAAIGIYEFRRQHPKITGI
jgi:tRNA G18 (ribose-2'-O)-methylase SpoU